MRKRTLLAAVTIATAALLGGAGTAVAGGAANGKTVNVPALGSGTLVRPALQVPTRVCIEPITTVGQILSPAFGDICEDA